MASTKIINVLKDDSFKEILDLFKLSSADEVIFVLPKKNKAFQKEDYFVSLRDEAARLNKTASFLCSNPELNELAKKHGFDVLLARQPKARSKTGMPKKKSAKIVEAGAVDMVNELEDFYEHPPISITAAAEADEELLAAAEEFSERDGVEAIPAYSRRMRDVVNVESDESRDLKVSSKKERAAPVGVRHHVPVVERRIVPKATMAGSGRYRKSLIGLAIAASILAGIAIYVSTGSAQITIQPRSQDLDMTLSVAASDATSAPDAPGMKLPGQLFNIRKTVSQEFPATGSKDVAQKARGSLTVYNATAALQQLIATTRFESSDKHIFRTLSGVIVPAAKTVNGKLVPGTVIVQVVADKSGQDFNVPAGIFKIPAFAEKGDANKYGNIYGQSDEPMRGGTSGKATVVTEQDYRQAQEILTAQVKRAIAEQLKADMDDFKVFDESQVAVEKPSSTAAADEAAERFTMTISGSLKTVGFKESDLFNLIAAYVDGKYDLHAVQEKLTLDYGEVKFDTATDILRFTVAIEGPGYAKINEQELLTSLAGKREDEIKLLIRGISDIAAANVVLRPPWVRSIPKDPSRVRIITSY